MGATRTAITSTPSLVAIEEDAQAALEFIESA
jgi:hypothetical protein